MMCGFAARASEQGSRELLVHHTRTLSRGADVANDRAYVHARKCASLSGNTASAAFWAFSISRKLVDKSNAKIARYRSAHARNDAVHGLRVWGLGCACNNGACCRQARATSNIAADIMLID